MKTYEEIVKEYRKRQHDTLVDSIAAGLTHVDEICIDTGILEETGIMTELTGTACSVLPFVIIAVSEGAKVVLGRKPGRTSLKDSAWRMAKTGVAMGVGGAVAAAAGLWAALPATMGVRALCDRWRAGSLTNARVKSRTERLRELRLMVERQSAKNGQTEALPAPPPDVVAEIAAEA